MFREAGTGARPGHGKKKNIQLFLLALRKTAPHRVLLPALLLAMHVTSFLLVSARTFLIYVLSLYIP